MKNKKETSQGSWKSRQDIVYVCACALCKYPHITTCIRNNKIDFIFSFVFFFLQLSIVTISFDPTRLAWNELWITNDLNMTFKLVLYNTTSKLERERVIVWNEDFKGRLLQMSTPSCLEYWNRQKSMRIYLLLSLFIINLNLLFGPSSGSYAVSGSFGIVNWKINDSIIGVSVSPPL